MEIIKELYDKQKCFFNDGNTLDVKNRIDVLRKLRASVVNNEQNIYDALRIDLGKPQTESLLSEFSGLIGELDMAIFKTKKWAAKKRVGTPLMLFPAVSYKQAQPYGQVLIISPWNYPLDLALSPLVSAIAAGNTAIIKPSEYSSTTANLIETIINEVFDEEYVSVVKGGIDESKALLELPFDYIFFTGSEQVGKIVYQAAAKQLIPVTLEMGGKCPAIITSDYSVAKAAKSIAWGKFFNAGQTCIAPDYALISKDEVDDFVKAFNDEIIGFLSKGKSHYTKLINEKEYHRITSYLKQGEVLSGGTCWEETLQVVPTIVQPNSMDEPIMNNEIFGPVLALVPYDDEGEIELIVNANPTPLSMYIFSGDKRKIKRFIQNITSGGVCVNDVLIGFANRNLPFGGIGKSGMGKYHGQYGFQTFSNIRGVVSKKQPDLPFRYPPYGSMHNFLRKVMALLIKNI